MKSNCVYCGKIFEKTCRLEHCGSEACIAKHELKRKQYNVEYQRKLRERDESLPTGKMKLCRHCNEYFIPKKGAAGRMYCYAQACIDKEKERGLALIRANNKKT